MIFLIPLLLNALAAGQPVVIAVNTGAALTAETSMVAGAAVVTATAE